MSNLILKKAFTILAPDKIEAIILETMGISTDVKRSDNSLLIKFKNHYSLYAFISKIYRDIEFTVYSKPSCRFILEIKI